MIYIEDDQDNKKFIGSATFITLLHSLSVTYQLGVLREFLETAKTVQLVDLLEELEVIDYSIFPTDVQESFKSFTDSIKMCKDFAILTGD